MSERKQQISSLYLEILNREPDNHGLDHYFSSNLSIEEIRKFLLGSEERKQKTSRRHIKLREHIPNVAAVVVADETLAKLMPILKDQFLIKKNNDGYISDENLPSDKTIKVLLGDSVPECLYVSEDKRIERLLSKNDPNTLYLNHGVSNTNIVDVMNIVVNKLLPLKISEILLLQGPADIFGPYTPLGGVSTVDGRTATNTELDYLQQRRVLLEGVVTVITGFGIKLTLATSAHRYNPDDPYLKNRELFLWGGVPTDERIQKCIQANQVTREVANKFNVPLIDFEKIMYDEFELLYDYFHFNEAGSEFCANVLIKHGF